MKNVFVLLVFGILLFGCTLPGGEPQGIQPPANGTQPPTTVAQHCSDGTALNSCSATAPFYCTASAELVEDAALCGCPTGTTLSSGSCIPLCSDGTVPGACTASRPLYCNSSSQLVERASECGCPSGKVRSGESCISACSDGTPAGECSATRPNYCTESSTLISDPATCGCPSGKVLLNGQCRDAKCTDGTAMGACSATLPSYCSESRMLVNDAERCGCPTGRVVSYNGSSCINPRMSSKNEDSFFNIATDVRMLARNSALQECANGDYISVEVRIDNRAYFSNFTVSTTDIILYVDNEDYPGDGGWMQVRFPENDSACSEPARFRWGTIPAGGSSSGIIWYELKLWDSDADYSLFYKDGFRVELRPDYER